MEIQKDSPTHYRYNDYAHEAGLEIKVTRFFPVRETKCCYFVISEHEIVHNLKNFIHPNPRVRKVLKGALRGYCHPTMEDALYSYKKRKEAQIGHNEFALAKANRSLAALEGVDSGFNKLSAGRPDYWDQLNFD